MVNRLFNPDITFVDSTGLPYAGGQLFFYASGTSTKLNTYSNAALTIANSNPVVLDSAGRAGAIFLQNLQYKVVLAPATDTDPPTSPIWTQDPVYTSDYSTAAQFTSGSGSPNGFVAGSAGSATIKASSYWDYTNNILYICTTTGTATTAVWTAINAATAANVVPQPQGYLTLTSGVPIIPSDVTAATTVYYTPYVGDDVPIYNGTSFVPQSIVSERQVTLTSSHVASNIYDFFIFSLNGVVTLGTGPSWSAGTGGSITAGSCARGTGAGGTALTMLQGILTNAASMVIRYGDGTTTTTVAANQATYVGSMFVDGTNGQVSCYRAWGQSRKWGIWNAYNRAIIELAVGDSTSSWSNASSAYRPINNNAANSGTAFCGLAEEVVDVQFIQMANTASERVGIGWNATNAASGVTGFSDSPNNIVRLAYYSAPPALGISTVTAIENCTSSTATVLGGQANCQMTIRWRG